jgi:hypothetical protein
MADKAARVHVLFYHQNNQLGGKGMMQIKTRFQIELGSEPYNY